MTVNLRERTPTRFQTNHLGTVLVAIGEVFKLHKLTASYWCMKFLHAIVFIFFLFLHNLEQRKEDGKGKYIDHTPHTGNKIPGY